MPPKIIITPRMHLTLVESTDLDDPNLLAMHKLRSDKEATSWSLHGASKTIEDTIKVASSGIPVLSGVDSSKDTPQGGDNRATSIKKDTEPDAEHAKQFRASYIARVRTLHSGKPNPENVASSDITSIEIKNEAIASHDRSAKGSETQFDGGVETGNNKKEPIDMSVESAIGMVGLYIPQLYHHPLPAQLAPPAGSELLRMELGYMFLPTDWGRGFAAEAASAILESYKNDTSWWARDVGDGSPLKKKLWVHSAIGVRNLRSIRVAEKIGLQKMGVQEWDGEKVFLGGDWQENKVVIFGKMLV